MENWKAIPGWEKYEVSDLGRARNVRTGKVLKPRKIHKGYLQVVLYNKDKKTKNFGIHQLVAMAFLDHVPCRHTITIDHINGCKTDNRLENLELVTNRENTTRWHVKRNTSSKFTGVCWNKKKSKWASNIRINGKQIFLGYFTSELEAAQAYQKALEDLNRRHLA